MGSCTELNNAQEKSLPEKHLESAFEMWWPRLMSQFQSLPSEESRMPHLRSERELLEEILDLVRNQGRMQDVPVLAGDKIESEIALWNQFIGRNERIDKLIRDAIESTGDSVLEFSIGTGSFPSGDKHYDGAQFKVRMVRTEKGKNYRFIIPSSMPLDQVLESIKNEIHRTTVNPPTD